MKTKPSNATKVKGKIGMLAKKHGLSFIKIKTGMLHQAGTVSKMQDKQGQKIAKLIEYWKGVTQEKPMSDKEFQDLNEKALIRIRAAKAIAQSLT